MNNQLGLHETLELHEILTFKNNSLTKSSAMRLLAKDEQLESLLSIDAIQSKQEIEQILSLLNQEGSHE